ncbi:MAG: 2-oxoglutarate dehydrogenase complex dihydrolipoyllysine-residue succinyltransferase [Rubinisphaera brasiliensis]|uniref:Dihydrolipoyllysine-residue succinyltransferase component of 2-oxoglutarate dehydrogenase complex n=1 Tax=Rubinisphaera brasiliensis (strain ATCC 49424 / DSM 5305 / JCM 21570 / IAM 15109 / NBRC 103401 / IFAM 1448) TaxID=756272 RepID=F0SS46_RUBBR|nr:MULTISPECIES: 2-oxoglutarate dehydrogenase complex dihydrolipoyllysine-residue succinyltransferase [Rubinisphaera]ADY58057.1 2-oxoglutarate dehydrogenase E2 component [Rubinisphaera brasiliensis DSM 5305]MBB02196.1 dihydrolipoyllysine-residue succinyltransferase [Planctomyces sp.]MBR9800770.1 2-oxoglutarate dehydrogenase complex dihydrolipoyllysine-residue succinyltransferase [bacterium]
MATEIVVPAVGESISEVQIGEWYVDAGKWVSADTDLVGLETDKATFDVPAPAGGRVTRIVKQAGETAAVGDVIAYFEEEEQPAGAENGTPESSAPAAKASGQPGQTSKPAAPTGGQAATSDKVMPAAARELAQRKMSADQVSPSGPGGRLLKEDVLAAEGTAAAPAAAQRSEEVVPLSPIRRRIAERLVDAQHNAALLTTFNEIDMSNVMSLRNQYKDSFIKKYDVKLGFMSFFVKAVVDALNQYPQVGAQMRDNQLVYRNYYDIGVAVGGGKGLVVPILRNAERMSFAEIELKISDFGRRARDNKISLDEMEGGSFTITNGGVYGSLLSTPIVNPPQSGVLGMHGIFERPVARNGEVVIRPMMYVALTYDHRVVDGREAVSFLKRICEAVEDPSRMLMEI